MKAPYLTSSLLTALPHIRHGFFTREGGCSTGLYASLNCGPGSDDDPKNVTENRRRALSSLDPAADDLCGLFQIHSDKAHLLERPWSARDLPRGDAAVTCGQNIALGILTADCAPVLFADRRRGVIGAAHAGWQGALNGIIQNTIRLMCQQGTERADIVAAVGPCIAPENYQVGPEFRARFVTTDPAYRQFFINDIKKEKYLFDLKGFVSTQLTEAGIDAIDVSPQDTYSDTESFFSYRRSIHREEADYGRQISMIMLS